LNLNLKTSTKKLRSMEKKLIKATRNEDKSTKRKICDLCHEKKVMKNVRYYLATSEESEDTTTQTLVD
jgi:hypothetical protein